MKLTLLSSILSLQVNRELDLVYTLIYEMGFDNKFTLF